MNIILVRNSTKCNIVDLANVFFSIPMEAQSQYWFAFTFKGKRYTWAVMPQGYTDSLNIFSRELHHNLKGFVAPRGSTLVKYVDDLLLEILTQIRWLNKQLYPGTQ